MDVEPLKERLAISHPTGVVEIPIPVKFNIMESKDIPPAEDFLLDYEQKYFQGEVFGDFAFKQAEVVKAMVNFAKAHVKMALKIASDQLDTGPLGVTTAVRLKLSIMEAYPEDNIK